MAFAVRETPARSRLRKSFLVGPVEDIEQALHIGHAHWRRDVFEVECLLQSDFEPLTSASCNACFGKNSSRVCCASARGTLAISA